jgi:hypothetical protein
MQGEQRIIGLTPELIRQEVREEFNILTSTTVSETWIVIRTEVTCIIRGIKLPWEMAESRMLPTSDQDIPERYSDGLNGQKVRYEPHVV